MMYPANSTVLVADIGGTNTRVALAQDGALIDSTITRYRNSEFSDLETVLRRYISDQDDVDPSAACIAVAGPVHAGVATLTNLDWTIDETTLARATGAETVAILNDLQAQGHALGHLPDHAMRKILPGKPAKPDASRLVIGVGTGFNIAPVHDSASGRTVTAAEAGHATLPAHTDADFSLSKFVAREHGFASVEDVLSGRGLEHVYAWLSQEAGDPGTRDAHDIMQETTQDTNSRSAKAAQVFAHTLGVVSGDLALQNLPFGGLYLVGGVARAIAPYLDQFGFAEAFFAKGRFAEFMRNFPVSVIEDDYAALIGSAQFLRSQSV